MMFRQDMTPPSTPRDESGRATEEPEALPMRLEPLMLAHLALTGDLEQRRTWRKQVDAIRHMKAVDDAPPEARALVRKRRVWRRMRFAGKVGGTVNLGLGAAWLSMLVPGYAVDLGFGWLAALTFLLPLPVAYRAARAGFERGALRGMAARRRWPGARGALAALALGFRDGYIGGFTFGFLLVFLGGLISAFMTPAPTLGAELAIDLLHGIIGGSIAGTVSSLLAPVLGAPAPEDSKERALAVRE